MEDLGLCLKDSAGPGCCWCLSSGSMSQLKYLKVIKDLQPTNIVDSNVARQITEKTVSVSLEVPVAYRLTASIQWVDN
jgi:hypothetical protein